MQAASAPVTTPSPVPTSPPTTRRAPTLAERWEHARAKAAQYAAEYGIRPLALDHRLWTLPSVSGGESHLVQGLDEHGLRYTCTCMAGQQQIPCWAQGAVASLPSECARREHHRAGIRVIHAGQHPAFDVDAEQARIAALNAKVDSLFS